MVVALFFGANFAEAQTVFNIQNYGARGDGKTMDTKAINDAIIACNKSGGGTVYFPSGTYVSGSIQLLSNVTLHLENGSKLLASPNLSDYDDIGLVSEYRSTAFIWAKDEHNINVTGHGVIDGNDMAFYDPQVLGPEWFVDYRRVRQGNDFKVRFPDGPLQESERPGMLMIFIGCEYLNFEGITVQNAPNWNIHLACCKYADFNNVKILNSLLVPNASGLDISQSQHVHVSGCTIIAGDDGIAISPCADGFCTGEASDVTVTNCTIESRSAGIRLGWAQNPIRNCIFQNLVLKSNRGILINARQEESIENIIFSDIVINTRLHSGWWGKAEPIHISQIPLDTTYYQSDEIESSINNIRFSNIIINSESGILLYAHNKNTIRDIYFNDVNMTISQGRFEAFSGGNFDLRPAFDNRFSVFAHDIPAFYFKGVKNLNVTGLDVSWTDAMPKYYSSAIYGEDFQGFKLNQSALSVHKGSDAPLIHLKNGRGVDLDKKPQSIKLENVQEQK